MPVRTSISTKASYLCRHARAADGERGVVLVLAVFAVVLLTVLAVGITAAVRVELMAARTSLERMQGLYLAEAGINQARAVLLYDDPSLDALTDDWGPEAEEPLDLPQEMAGGLYRVRVYDASGRIDINQADLQTMTRLIGDMEIANAIVEWREEAAKGLDEGTGADFYISLPYPYMPRNGPFQSPGELLLVKGVTPELFYGSKDRVGLADLITVDSLSINRTVNGEWKLNLNEFRSWNEPKFQEYVLARLGGAITFYDADKMIWPGLNELMQQGLPGYTSLSQLATAAHLDYGKIAQLIDLVTVDSQPFLRGMVNVNTAPLEVIAALPGSSISVAQSLIERRKQAPFLTLGEVILFLAEQPEGGTLFEQMIDHITTKSSVFLIESMGWPVGGRSQRTLTALVRRREDSVTVIRQAEQDWPMPPPAEEEAALAARR